MPVNSLNICVEVISYKYEIYQEEKILKQFVYW